ncbi:MAG: ArnT family glycosyltransferase, partial [Armatimonadota bacterium]
MEAPSNSQDERQPTCVSSNTEMHNNKVRLNSGEIIGLALVFTLGIVVRVAYLLQYKSNVPYYAIPIVDSSYYDGWARTVIAGQGYGATPFYLAPLYPYFLAFLYLISGSSLTFVYIVQSILGLVTTGLVYVLGRWMFDHKHGLVAAALIQFYAPLIYLEPKLLTEPLAITLNLASLVLVWRAVNCPSRWRFVVAGIMLGLSAVCRAVGLITISLVAIWLVLLSLKLRSRSGFSPTGITLSYPALVVLGACLAILPVSVRNATIGRDFTLISTNGGIVFAQGNNQTATGISMPLPNFSGVIVTQQQEEMAIASEELGYSVTPSESSHYWYNVGMKFIQDNPGRFLRLLGKKFLWSIHNAEPGCSYNVYAEKMLVPMLRMLGLPFVLLAGLALFGVIVGYKTGSRHVMALVGLYIASIYLGLLITSVSSRYRVPAVPGLAIFAGFGLVRLLESLASRRLRPVLFFLGCLLPFVV